MRRREVQKKRGGETERNVETVISGTCRWDLRSTNKEKQIEEGRWAWDGERWDRGMWRDVERQMGRRKEGEKWRVARWNSTLKLLTARGRNIFGELYFWLVCVFGYLCVLTVLSHYMVNHSIANMNSLFVYITLCGCVPLRRSILSWSIVWLCVCVRAPHYTHSLSVMCLETPVCNGWKSALPAGLASNCWSGFCS